MGVYRRILEARLRFLHSNQQLRKVANMKGTMTVLGLLTLAVATPSVMAQTQTPRVTKHQFKQEARIHNGVKSGELTRGEAVRLHAQQAKIKRDKKRAACLYN